MLRPRGGIARQRFCPRGETVTGAMPTLGVERRVFTPPDGAARTAGCHRSCSNLGAMQLTLLARCAAPGKRALTRVVSRHFFLDKSRNFGYKGPILLVESRGASRDDP